MQQQPPVPAEQQQPEQRQPSRMQGRREVLLCSSALWLLLAEMSGGGLDGRTVVNSLLGECMLLMYASQSMATLAGSPRRSSAEPPPSPSPARGLRSPKAQGHPRLPGV